MKTPAQVENIIRHISIEEYLNIEFEKKIKDTKLNESNKIDTISIIIPDNWGYDDLMIADEYLKLFGWDSEIFNGRIADEEKAPIFSRMLKIFPRNQEDLISKAALVSQLSQNIEIVNKNRIKTDKSYNPYETSQNEEVDETIEEEEKNV